MSRLAWVFLIACHAPALPPASSGKITIVGVTPATTSDNAGVTWTSSVSGNYIVALDSGVIAARGQVAAGATMTTAVTSASLSSGDNPGAVSVFPTKTQSLFAPFVLSLSSGSTNGGTATLSFDAATYDFATRLTGSVTSKTLTLSNTGTGTATFATPTSASLGLSAPFALATTTCTASLAAGATCTLAVTFTPTVSGAASATVALAYDNGSATAALTANATAPCDSVGNNPSLTALGSGTPADPYILCNDAQLMALSQTSSAWTASYRMGHDIDLSAHGPGAAPGQVFDAIGRTNPYFYGRFDGGGFAVKNLTITTPGTCTIGLFGQLEQADVRNLTLENVNISGDCEVGAIAGSADTSTLSNLHTSGSVTGTTSVGGLFGDAGGSAISASSSAVTVIGTISVGGLVGGTDGAGPTLIYNSYATGDVSGENAVGGFMGSIYGGFINQSYASGNVSASSDNVGGFVGYVDGFTLGLIERSFAFGSVSGDSDPANNWVGPFIGRQAGGIFVGDVSYSATTTCNNTDPGPDAACNSNAATTDGALLDFERPAPGGPLAAWDFASTWQDNSASDQLPSLKPVIDFDSIAWGDCSTHQSDVPFAGGNGTVEAPFLICTPEQLVTLADNLVINSARWNGLVYKLMADLDMSGVSAADIEEALPIANTIVLNNNYVGFTGRFDGNGHTISGLTITGVTNKSGLGLFSSLPGQVARLGIINSTFSGAAGGDCIANNDCVNGGAIAGNFSGSIVASYANATVTADRAGGLVGTSQRGFIRNCYSLGSVNGLITAGGLVGQAFYPGIFLTASFSVTTVTLDPSGADGDAAPIVGGNSGGDFTDSRYDSSPGRCPNHCDTSPNEGVGVNLSLAGQSSFFYSSDNPPMNDPDNPWDFANTWQSDGQSYPTLVSLSQQ